MGVHGLWKLLEPVGRTISIETLEGKVPSVAISRHVSPSSTVLLAVDIGGRCRHLVDPVCEGDA